MTRMAPSRTALPGIRPVQVLSNLSRRTDRLNRAGPILYAKSGEIFGRMARTQTKTRLHRPLLHLVQVNIRI